MKETNSKYTVIRKKYLADALCFLNFKYMKFTDNEGNIVYSFENTEKFNEGINKLLQLRKELTN